MKTFYNKRHPKVFLIAIMSIILPCLAFLTFLITWATGSIDYNSLDLFIFLAMYILTVLGITVGYHRYFTHKSFKTNKIFAGTLIVLGSMAMQGPLLFWVGVHRKHHAYQDGPQDPHSPHSCKNTPFAKIKGFYHAHIGWMLNTKQFIDYKKYIPDLLRDRFICKMSSWYFYWAALGLLAPALIEGWITGTVVGFIKGFLVGGLVRVCAVQQVTWGVNSLGHLFGAQHFNTNNESRNNTLLGLLGLGEGWHNNHHAFPTSAKHGHLWWQIDIGYLTIKLLSYCRIVHKIVLPSLNDLNKKKRSTLLQSE